MLRCPWRSIAYRTPQCQLYEAVMLADVKNSMVLYSPFRVRRTQARGPEIVVPPGNESQRQMKDNVVAAGKRVSSLVQEQLQFCRHLQRVDLVSAMQVREIFRYRMAFCVGRPSFLFFPLSVGYSIAVHEVTRISLRRMTHRAISHSACMTVNSSDTYIMYGYFLMNLFNPLQGIATDEECLKKANSLLLLLKADVRAFNACAARVPPSSHGEAPAPESPGCTDEAARRYGWFPESTSWLVPVRIHHHSRPKAER